MTKKEENLSTAFNRVNDRNALLERQVTKAEILNAFNKMPNIPQDARSEYLRAFSALKEEVFTVAQMNVIQNSAIGYYDADAQADMWVEPESVIKFIKSQSSVAPTPALQKATKPEILDAFNKMTGIPQDACSEYKKAFSASKEDTFTVDQMRVIMKRSIGYYDADAQADMWIEPERVMGFIKAPSPAISAAQTAIKPKS